MLKTQFMEDFLDGKCDVKFIEIMESLIFHINAISEVTTKDDVLLHCEAIDLLNQQYFGDKDPALDMIRNKRGDYARAYENVYKLGML